MTKLFYLRLVDTNDDWFKRLESLSTVVDEVVCFTPGDLSVFLNSLEADDTLLAVDEEVWSGGSVNLKELHKKQILVIDSKSKNFDNNLLKLKSAPFAGTIDISNRAETYLPWFKTLLNWEPFAEKKSLLENIDQILGNTLTELNRLKTIHDKVVPLRSEQVKGLSLFSKYAAGESAGGEFFDVVKGEGQVLFILTNAKSYVASSIILSHFEELRQSTHFDNELMEKFIDDLTLELKNLELVSRDHPENLQLMIAFVDLKKMNVSGYLFGEISLVSSEGKNILGNNYPVDELFLEKAHFDYKLSRAEKILILSPGFNKNAGLINPPIHKPEDLVKQFGMGAKDLLNELFFNLKSHRKGDFLKFDASALFLEVDQNVIVQV